MSDKTKIEWADASWNPVTGCDEVSPGCDHCYAKTFAERWRGTPGHYFEQGFDVQIRWNKLEEPLKWTRSRRVFVNSMSDLFHEGVSDAFIAEVFAVMAKAPQHIFQLLTKRHGRMRSLLNQPSFRDCVLDASPAGVWPLPNLWLGVSVENQQWADIRIPALLDTPAAVRWLSCEPLLGPVRLPLLQEMNSCTCGGYCEPYYIHEPMCGVEPGPAWGNLHWVVVGGESGRKARPMDADWARSLRDQCTQAGVPYFFKQWGAWGPSPEAVIERLLDGRSWNEYPVAVAS